MGSPYIASRSIENFYLVRERDRRHVRELVLLVFGLVPVALALLAYTWIHLEVRKYGYRIEEQERRFEVLQHRERRLRLEYSFLSSPDRIEGLAASQLGMVTPRLEQMIFLEE